jgi:hypothetical protein
VRNIIPEAGRVALAKQKAAVPKQAATEILRDLLILQLGVARVPQDKIRKIAHCGMNRVNDILKHIPKTTRKSSREGSK